jgi:hypothetical protein
MKMDHDNYPYHKPNPASAVGFRPPSRWRFASISIWQKQNP